MQRDSTPAGDDPPAPPPIGRPGPVRVSASPHSTRCVLFPRWGSGLRSGTERTVSIASNVPG